MYSLSITVILSTSVNDIFLVWEPAAKRIKKVNLDPIIVLVSAVPVHPAITHPITKYNHIKKTYINNQDYSVIKPITEIEWLYLMFCEGPMGDTVVHFRAAEGGNRWGFARNLNKITAMPELAKRECGKPFHC